MRVHVSFSVSAQPVGAKLGNTTPPSAPSITQNRLTGVLCRADTLHLWLSAVTIFLLLSGVLGVCYSMTAKSSAVAPNHTGVPSPSPMLPVQEFLRGVVSSASRRRIWAEKNNCLAPNVREGTRRMAAGCERSYDVYGPPTPKRIQGSSLLQMLCAGLLGITLQAPRPLRSLVAYALAAWSGLHIALLLQDHWLEKSKVGSESDRRLPWLQIAIFIGSVGALAVAYAQQKKRSTCDSR